MRDAFAEILNEAHWLPRYGEGRVCSLEGCGTILNPYNESDHCGAHQVEPDNRYCGYPVIVCAHCGEAAITTKTYHASYRCGICGRVRG